MKKRPNILFLMSDEHRFNIAGFAGNKIIKTPTLDQLAESGVVFENAYTPSPICIPARQCMMAGQLPKTCKCEGWIDLAPNYMTFARRFSQYAYHTVCVGKLHHLGTDQMQGWTRRISPDAIIADNYIEDRVDEEFKKYKPAAGTGKWSNEREIKEARVATGPYQRFDMRAMEGFRDFVEQYFVDREYLRPQSHRPLLLKLSLLQPHYPYFTDQARFDYYYKKVPLYNETPCLHPVLSLSQQNEPVNVSEEEIRRATAAYYGMVDQVDSYFAEALKILRSVGENLDEWIIIYTADHGEMLGEHGIWEKTRFYEGSVRVPLIIRWPERFSGGRRIFENVSLCDLFATLCDSTGIPAPSGLDSRSLVPLLDGNHYDWNNEVIAQMYTDHLMIKRDHLKYQFYGNDLASVYGENIPEVLFDLADDPLEKINQAENPDYTTVMEMFRQRRTELMTIV
ncbi:MAG: sulfatase-like hydrolase/transferase [Dehalococcoidales bacterium]